MTTFRTRAAAVLTGAALITAGCGGSSDLSDNATTQLQEVAAAARSAVEAGDDAGAAAHLDDLRTRVDRLRDNGEISEERAATILETTDEIATRLAVEDAEPPAEPEPAEPEPTDPPPPPDDDDDDDEKGRGKGEDRGEKRGKKDD